jgi:hypothetical protein
VPALVVSKSSVPTSGTTVSEGQVITYTLTFANTAGRAPAPVDYTDDLTRVLDDATVTTPPAVSTGAGLTLSPISGGRFTITGTIAAGATATVTLSVTVNTPDTGDHRLDNFLVPTGTTPPAECEPGALASVHMFAPVQTETAPSTCTTHPVPVPAPPTTTTVRPVDPNHRPPMAWTGVNQPVGQTLGLAGLLLLAGTALLLIERRHRARR